MILSNACHKLQTDFSTSGKWKIISLRKTTGQNVAVRIITVFEMDELEEIIGELKKITQKESEYFGKVYDCFIYSCNLYLVMEYFENGSLMDAVIENYLDHEEEDDL
jgi:serine/threonine protein kinase